MKNPISSFRAWLGRSTVPSHAVDPQQAPKERAGSSRQMTVAPALGALKRQNARRMMPDATPSSSHRPPPRTSSDDEALREAVAAIRAAAVWTPPSSEAESPRVSVSDRSRLSSARIDSPGRDTHSLRTEGSSGHHQAKDPSIDEDREALLDMAWDTDFPSARMNEILARSPELVDAPDHSGATLLVNALTGGNIEFAKALIDHGADPNVRDELGNTPLHLAAGRGAEIVSRLLAAGADPGAVNHRGATALFDARSPEVAHALLGAGTPIDARDRKGNTAIMRIAQSGTRATVLAVLEHNPDISIRNESDHTFAQLLTARFGGAADVIPGTAGGAKAFLELAARETPFLGDLRDREPAVAVRLRPSEPVAREEELRIQPELKLAAASANAKKPAINSLKSGPKLSFVNDPKRAFDELNDRHVEALSEALGFGKLSSDHDTYMQQKAAIRATFARFGADIERFLADYDNAALEHEALNAPLTPEERAELRSVMDIAHLRVAAERGPGGGLLEPLRLRVFFDGTQNMRDFKQDIGSAFGRIGEVDRAAKRAGELFAKILSHPDRVQLDFIAGQSMGGAMAQTFRATVESRVVLPKQPSMILMDPQLLNDNQARRATKGGMLEVDYAQPRGVALTLDYAKDPRRGLMGIMKGPGGYRYPGLVQLRLGLTDTDGYGDSRPETSGLPGMGYHVDPRQYANALARFCADREREILEDPAFDHLRAPNWTRTAGPMRTSSTLLAVARRARRPMEPIVEDEESARET
jgi:Ankyrin repeats (3 copies)